MTAREYITAAGGAWPDEAAEPAVVEPAIDELGRALVADEVTEARLAICRACGLYTPNASWGGCLEIEGCCAFYIQEVRAGRCPRKKFGGA